MSVSLEIERKFLIRLPKSWSSLSDLLDGVKDVKRITQSYLKAEKGEQSARVRKTVEGLSGETKTVYHFNQKKPTGETGVHEEKEHNISEKEYESYLKKSDPNKCPVEKTRFVFDFHNQTFELDIFKGHLKGLAILELELEDPKDTIELPSFLKVIKEVTKDKEYNNFNLANKELKNNILEF